MLILAIFCYFGITGVGPGQDGSDQRLALLGHGVGLFRAGELLAEDNFENLENWQVQMQERKGFAPARVGVSNGKLDCFVPGRGCTIWFKKKLKTRVAITYDVLCPTPRKVIEGLRPRDINNFWMCSDVGGSADGLFDPEKYTGSFKTYHKMQGYYASIGGGKAASPTTRMRRYPREAAGKPVSHIALDDKDGRLGYLINPDQVMKVQLVVYDGLVQYIVDGKLIYQMKHDDVVTIENPGADGKGSTIYSSEKFPAYREGYFGFRMVGTHHIYSNFRVHALEPELEKKSRPLVRVDSLEGFRVAVAKSDQQIVLKPGEYRVPDRRGFRLSGSNNEINLTGVVIKVPLEKASGKTLFRLSGDRIILRGGVVEDTYPNGMTEVTDFGAYNRNRKFGGMNEMSITGDDNRVVGMKMTVRGSFPYGYGNMYGIGGGAVVNLNKHCGIQITGDRAMIDGGELKMEAFGHAIYVQGGDRTRIRNTIVEGTLRPSNDCYQEMEDGDLAKKFNYQLQWPELVRGLPIPRDHMINCTEDGIRAYKGAGEMIVENCVVRRCRGGIKLYMAKSAKVSNCLVEDCVVQGYTLPSRGVIENSSGNAAYGPLLYVHSDNHSRQQIDLKVLPSPHSLGDHPLAALKGRGHKIKLTSVGAHTKSKPRPIIVGYFLRFDFLCVDYPDIPKGHEKLFAKYSPGTYKASEITVENSTGNPVVLGELSKGNTIRSLGEVLDFGEGNLIK
jgi:hypothetical protein